MPQLSDPVREADRRHVLERTVGLWEDLRGKRIFLTGGTGFVGTWLLEALAAANAAYELNATAVVLTRDPARFRRRAPHLANDPSILLHCGDATSFAAPDGPFEVVIHAATERWFEPDRERPLGILALDFAATCRVLDFVATAGVRRLLLTSSGAVYGGAGAALARIPESFGGAPDLGEPRSAYGESKRLSEFACRAYARQYAFDATIGRLFAFVGPHLPLDEGYAVGNFLRDILEERAVRVAGDGTPRRSYLYAADLAIWLWTICLRGRGGRAYNVGSPEGLSIRALAEAVARAGRTTQGVTIARSADPSVEPLSYVPDTSRAETELGLRAWIGLDDALRRTYHFLLATQRNESV